MVNVKDMAKAYSYVVKRDFGFAPNPFHGFLTLATCKQRIRKVAQVNDFIIGVAPVEFGSKLVYMAKISRVITFDEYWSLPEFACKKPVMNGSNKVMFGDNIYHHLKDGSWMQEDSHHTNPDGSINQHNLERDTGKTDRVLVADEFFYFGKGMIDISANFGDCIHHGINHSSPDINKCQELWDFLQNNYEQGIIDFPRQFKEFVRYDGVS